MNYSALVSVPVLTYNSSKTIIETLDSIYKQTYPRIELIISDDCSTDNTIELCHIWIEAHKERFIHTQILTVDKNTGTSGNGNRAEAACNGEWVKGIAGDDLLVEDCIESCVNYVNEHKGVTILFGRQEAFGTDEEKCKNVNKIFNYDMLLEPAEKQLATLLCEDNYIPATTMFFHRERILETGVKNDERIPLLEDWPKWINLLKAGLNFNFIDKVLVRYRISGISNNGRFNINYYRSYRLFDLYYRFPERSRNNLDEAIEHIINEEEKVFAEFMKLEQQLYNIQHSKAYKLGKALLHPVGLLRKSLFSHISRHDECS